MTTFQRPGGPRRARKPEQVSPRDRPPSDAQRARSLAEAQGMLSDDSGTSLVERNAYDFRDEQPEPPRAKPALDWTAEAARIEDVEPVLDVHTAEVAAEARSEVLVSPEAMGAGAVGEEVGTTARVTHTESAIGRIVPGSMVDLGASGIGFEVRPDGFVVGADKSDVTDLQVNGSVSGTKTHNSHLAKMLDAQLIGLAVGGETLQWAIDEIARLMSGGLVLEWNYDMEEAPDDGTPFIGMARYADRRGGFPRMVAFVDGAWREPGRTIGEPLVCWAWISRDVLPEWPAEPA